ncbi:MAG: hypothetical protein ACKOA8_00265, partial [Deltaproteobacteria bacterium]
YFCLTLSFLGTTGATASHDTSTQRDTMSEESIIELTDIPRTIKDPSGDLVKITFVKQAGIYVLKKSNSHFESLLNELQRHQKSNRPIRLRVRSSSLEIIEVLSQP